MQQSKSLNLPATPTYYQNPLQNQDIANQSNVANNLVNGNIPAWLQSTINPNNSQNALTAAQGILQPQFRDTLQQINNNAAANNQLNSSTYTDALARSQSDLNSQYQSIVSQQAINDSNQANQNKLSLFGNGLSDLSGAIGSEQQDTGAQNSFNLSNYDNQVASAVQQNQNANKANPLTQIESMFSPIAHDYYQGQGINSVPGYGVGQTLQMAGSIAGLASGMGGLSGGGGFGSGGLFSYSPGASASNNPFNNYQSQFGYNNGSAAWDPQGAINAFSR